MPEPKHAVATLLHPLMRYMASQGVDTEALLARHQLTPAQLQDPEQRLSVKISTAILNEAETLMADPSLAINVARFVDYSTFGGLGLAQAAGGSVSHVLQRIVRYHRLISDVVVSELDTDHHQLCIRFRPASDYQPHPQAVLFAMVSLVRLMRFRLDRYFNPVRVTTPAHVPEATRAAMSRYCRCPVTVDQHYLLAFDAARADSRLNASDQHLASMLEASLQQRLADLETASLSTRLSLWIEHQLPAGEPTLAMAADDFHLSVRSLQRRLADEGQHWTGLLEDTRKALVERHMTTPNMTVTQLAFLLGFSEVSAFSRAFRKWYGVPPSRFDERGTLGGAGSSGRIATDSSPTCPDHEP